MSGVRRDRLQKTNSGRILADSSMNDFPIPEDPPVMMTAEMFLRAASGEGIENNRLIFRSPGYRQLLREQPKTKPQL
jgi:hypothetical protein